MRGYSADSGGTMPRKPRLASFPTLEAYLDALVDWKLDLYFSTIDREWLRLMGVKPE
jgi:hypothetical protein